MSEFKKQLLVNLPIKESDMLDEMSSKTHKSKTEIIKMAITALYNNMRDTELFNIHYDI